MFRLFSRNRKRVVEEVVVEPRELVETIREHLILWGLPHKTVYDKAYLYTAMRKNDKHIRVEYFVVDIDLGETLTITMNKEPVKITKLAELTPEITPIRISFFKYDEKKISFNKWREITPAIGLFELKDKKLAEKIDYPETFTTSPPREEFMWKKSISIKIYYIESEKLGKKAFIDATDEKRGISLYFRAGESIRDALDVLDGIRRVRVVAEGRVLEL